MRFTSTPRPVVNGTVSVSLFTHLYSALHSLLTHAIEHWGHQSTQLYYNNLKHADVPHTLDNGIHHWTTRGGIVARGVLIDYLSWATRNGKSYKATDRHEITVDDLEAIAAEQKVEFRPGDVLIVRSGMVKWYNEANEEERLAGVTNGHTYVGVAGTEKSVRWLWEHHFSAIAGDAIAFEAWPPSGDFSEFLHTPRQLHRNTEQSVDLCFQLFTTGL